MVMDYQYAPCGFLGRRNRPIKQVLTHHRLGIRAIMVTQIMVVSLLNE